MHLIISNGPSDSLEDCSSNHATIVSCRVPFKWEEAPGKPIAIANMSSCNNDLLAFNLQLPPKLQCQGHQTPLFLQQRLHQSSPLSLHSPSPNHPKLKRLCKYMLKTASWSQPPTHLRPQSWSSSACAITDDKHDALPLNERFFFDRAIPKEFKYSVSMDSSWKAQHEKYKRRDAFVSSEALSFLPMEEHEAESSACSPLQPIMFHERHGSASSWQPTSIKASKELEGDDDDNDEAFHDLFSTASSSLDKPSQRTDESMESSCPSPSPWFLDFGPKEHEMHEERGGSKLVVRLVAIIKLKNIISSKVCKLRKRREGANQQANNTSMWSPTLATYLFNQQKEERQSRSPSLHLLASEDNDHLLASEDEGDDDDDHDDGDDDELPSSSSAASSHRFYINPDYHLPSSILRGHLHSNNDISESPGSSSFRVNQLGLEWSPCFSEEKDEDEDDEDAKEEDPHRLSLREQLAEFDEEDANEEDPHRLSLMEQLAEFDEDKEEAKQEDPHRLSLREQLAEFDDDYPLQFVPTQSTAPPILHSQKGEKGMCKVRKTVKVIAATIKLILVQTEVRKRKGQRPSVKYGSCLKPTLGTLTPLPSTHK